MKKRNKKIPTEIVQVSYKAIFPSENKYENRQIQLVAQVGNYDDPQDVLLSLKYLAEKSYNQMQFYDKCRHNIKKIDFKLTQLPNEYHDPKELEENKIPLKAQKAMFTNALDLWKEKSKKILSRSQFTEFQ